MCRRMRHQMRLPILIHIHSLQPAGYVSHPPPPGKARKMGIMHLLAKISPYLYASAYP